MLASLGPPLGYASLSPPFHRAVLLYIVYIKSATARNHLLQIAKTCDTRTLFLLL